MSSRIPLVVPDFSTREFEYVQEALTSSWISRGRFIERFEQVFAPLCGAAHAVAVCNGTAALHLALVLSGLETGDEVILPASSYVATANAVVNAGGRPVFVDIEPQTWTLDVDQVAHQISERTRGIVAVHLYGHLADMEAINALATKRGLWVIEDAAQGIFAMQRDRAAGSFGNTSAFSFFGNKILAAGEGGAITVNDGGLDHLARLLRNNGCEPGRPDFSAMVGYNFRPNNLSFAVLVAQLERRDELIRARNRVMESYRDNLRDVPGLVLQPVAAWATLSPWLFTVRISEPKFGCSRDLLAEVLSAHGVETRRSFAALHRLPAFVADAAARHTRCEHADAFAADGLSLPTYPALDTAVVAHIADIIRQTQANLFRGKR